MVSLLSLGQSSNAKAPTIEYEEVRLVLVSAKEAKYSDLIAKLNCCENHCKWDENKILDSNNKYSYGGLMFQKGTWLSYGKKYNILPYWINDDNFERYIYDRDIQMLIAEKMIEEGIGGSYAGWYNCWRKYNLSQYL